MQHNQSQQQPELSAQTLKKTYQPPQLEITEIQTEAGIATSAKSWEEGEEW